MSYICCTCGAEIFKFDMKVYEYFLRLQEEEEITIKSKRQSSMEHSFEHSM